MIDTIYILDGEGNNIENQEKRTSGVGHAYCVLHNNMSHSINVGQKTVSSGDSVSIGLWAAPAVGSSLSSSSSSNDDSFNHSGVLHNYERCFYTRYERPQNDVYVKRTIAPSTLANVSTVIKDKNDIYNAVIYNCATFATELWNSIDSKNYYTGWFRAPRFIHNEIKSDYSTEY